jgi:acyl-CoA thioesterase-1
MEFDWQLFILSLSDSGDYLLTSYKLPAMRFLIALFFMLTAMFLHAQQKIKVACIGNSITEGQAIQDESMRYPQQLQKLMGDGYDVRNFGVSGRTLLRRGDFPYWQEQKYQDVLAWAPDVVIIKLGTNDSKPQNWIYSDEFEGDYRDFIRSFKDLPGKRKIYICTPIPVFQDAWGITESIVKDEIIPIVRAVAKSEKVMVIDLYTPMIGKDALVPDGVHPGAEGATVMANEIFKVINPQLTMN